MRQQALIDELRSSHLAREDGLPLLDPTTPIVPPPHIETMADIRHALVGRYADLAERGCPSRLVHVLGQGAPHPGCRQDRPGVGDHQQSHPGRDELSRYAATAHNQAMLGEPIRAGRFPNQMGADIEGAGTPASRCRGTRSSLSRGHGRGVEPEFRPHLRQRHAQHAGVRISGEGGRALHRGLADR